MLWLQVKLQKRETFWKLNEVLFEGALTNERGGTLKRGRDRTRLITSDKWQITWKYVLFSTDFSPHPNETGRKK